MNANDFKDKAFEEMLKYAFNEASKEMIDEMPPCEEVEFSKEHEAKMRKLFAGKVRKKKYIKRILVIAAVMVAILSVSVMSVQGLRIRFMNFILNFTESNTKITYVDETEDKNSYTVGDIVFEYLPSGFTLDSTRNQGKVVYIDFVNNDKFILIKINTKVFESNVDTEKADAELVVINGIESFVTQKDDVFIINWNNGSKAFDIQGNIDRKEIIQVAENIKIK